MVSVLRPGQHILNIPGYGVQTSRRAVASGVNWSQWFDHCWVAKNASSLGASYIDLVGSTTLSLGVAPALGASGWGFSGSQYLTTGLIPSATWTMMVQYTSAAAGAFMAGRWPTGSNDWFAILPNNTTNVRYMTGSVRNASPALASGNLAIAGLNCYRNGSPDGAAASSGSGYNTEIWIGGVNGGGMFFTGNIVAFGLKASTMSSADAAAAYAAMAAL